MAFIDVITKIITHGRTVKSNVQERLLRGDDEREVEDYRRKQHAKLLLELVHFTSSKSFFYVYSSVLSGVCGALIPAKQAGVMIGLNVASLTSDIVFARLIS